MKKISLLLIATILAQFTYGQTNTFPTSGNVGIGTTSPSTALQIGDFSGGSASSQLLIPGTYNFEQVRLGQIGNGNSALEFVNHTSFDPSYGIKFLVDVDHGASGLQIQYAASATSYASLNYVTGLYMNLSGNIGIGTTSPDAKLAVNGTIHSKQVNVDMTGWSDFVFKKDYDLPSLEKLKTYIGENHHLPGVPSEQEVIKEGVNLGEMNRILLKKVEELTLYLLEKDNADKKKDTQLQAQQIEIDQLKAQMASLIKLTSHAK